MSLSPRKLCLRYWNVLLEQWGGAPSCWNTTMFISVPLFLLNATANFQRHHLYVPLCVASHTIYIIIFKKIQSEDPPFAHSILHCNFLLTQWLLAMFMRLLRWPKPHVLLVDMPTQMKMDFVIKQNQAKITWVVLNSSTSFFPICIGLFLEDSHFVWKQL